MLAIAPAVVGPAVAILAIIRKFRAAVDGRSIVGIVSIYPCPSIAGNPHVRGWHVHGRVQAYAPPLPITM